MISIPIMKGTIDRRILVNYNIDAEVMARHLPAPFRPKLVSGRAIAGICLIRLKNIRPSLAPVPWGLSSENAAHRIAIEWEDRHGQTKEGVYIPRRDTDSLLNVWSGGRLFPGVHYHARFSVHESSLRYSVSLNSSDHETKVSVLGWVDDRIPAESVFVDTAEASAFFAAGSLGYSATEHDQYYDGLELRCQSWSVEPLDIETVESSYFDNPRRFPTGSIKFDSALLMRDIEHQWVGHRPLRASVN